MSIPNVCMEKGSRYRTHRTCTQMREEGKKKIDWIGKLLRKEIKARLKIKYNNNAAATASAATHTHKEREKWHSSSLLLKTKSSLLRAQYTAYGNIELTNEICKITRPPHCSHPLSCVMLNTSRLQVRCVEDIAKASDIWAIAAAMEAMVAKSNSEHVTFFPQIDVDAFGFFPFRLVWFGWNRCWCVGRRERCDFSFVSFNFHVVAIVCLGVSTITGLNKMNGVKHTWVVRDQTRQHETKRNDRE